MPPIEPRKAKSPITAPAQSASSAPKPSPIPKPGLNKLTNRAAGLIHKPKSQQQAPPVASTKPTTVPLPAPAPINNITEQLKAMAVDISTLKLDPDNARLHPERNKQAIKASLSRFGQLKPIVVRKSDGVIVAGNGTWECAKELGWTKIAACYVALDSVDAADYGMADNRTSDLAKWDFEVVARLDKLIHDAGRDPIGWSSDELEVLRMADWKPPAIDDSDYTGAAGGHGGGGGGDSGESGLLINFSPDEFEIVSNAIERVKKNRQGTEVTPGQCLMLICKDWIQSRTTNSSDPKDTKSLKPTPPKRPEIEELALIPDLKKMLNPRTATSKEIITNAATVGQSKADAGKEKAGPKPGGKGLPKPNSGNGIGPKGKA